MKESRAGSQTCVWGRGSFVDGGGGGGGGGGGFFFACEGFGGRSFIPHPRFFFFFFKEEISSPTQFPLFRPGSVDSGSAS